MQKEKSSKDILGHYFAEISNHPLLTKEEEKELAFKIQNGDEDALNKLVQSNLKFVVKIAKKYRGHGVALADLVSEGNLGLIEAARRFDPDRNVKFISYAVWWIRQHIITAVSNMGHPFRLPNKINNAIYKVASASGKKLSLSEPNTPSKDLAEASGLSLRDVILVRGISKSVISLNTAVDSEHKVLLESLLRCREEDSIEALMVKTSIQNTIRDALEHLKPSEQQILRYRFGFHDDRAWSLREIGEVMGLSRERIRQIEDGALQKLRRNRKTKCLQSNRNLTAV